MGVLHQTLWCRVASPTVVHDGPCYANRRHSVEVEFYCDGRLESTRTLLLSYVTAATSAISRYTRSSELSRQLAKSVSSGERLFSLSTSRYSTAKRRASITEPHLEPLNESSPSTRTMYVLWRLSLTQGRTEDLCHCPQPGLDDVHLSATCSENIAGIHSCCLSQVIPNHACTTMHYLLHCTIHVRFCLTGK